jgi:hypothetical protein
MQSFSSRFARLAKVSSVRGVPSRAFSQQPSMTPEQQAEVLKAFQAKTGMPDMPDATVDKIDPSVVLEQLKAMEERDPYDVAASLGKDWTPPATQPQDPDMPTYVTPDPVTDHRPDIRAAPAPEVKKGDLKSHSFQTETRQMLDIVTNSLYTDKEVFLRELVSNASDALEKTRYVQTKEGILNPDVPFEIRIFADEEGKTLTIQDTGIGMTQSELISNLGTIARSGSKQWVKDVKDGNTDSIIGQFGVGFYSGFMVGEKMEVYSRSAKLDADGYVDFVVSSVLC